MVQDPQRWQGEMSAEDPGLKSRCARKSPILIQVVRRLGLIQRPVQGHRLGGEPLLDW